MLASLEESRKITASSRLTLVAGAALVCLAMLAASGALLAGARYLPTRSDETDVEILKELIRELMTRSNAIEPKSSSHGQQFQAGRFQVERRSMEMPVRSDGDAYLAPVGIVVSGSQPNQRDATIKLD